MKTRIIKEDKKQRCPVTVAFGSSRFWGSFYEEGKKDKKKPATFIVMFVKDITPKIFDEYLEHEMLHQGIYMVRKTNKKKWTKHQEHWAIDRILQAREDWF